MVCPLIVFGHSLLALSPGRIEGRIGWSVRALQPCIGLGTLGVKAGSNHGLPTLF